MPDENQYLPVKLSHKAINELISIYLPEDLEPEDEIELVIIIEDENVNVREFAAYLNFVDRTYGRLTSRDLANYVQRREIQLTVSSFRTASLEALIREVAARTELITALVILRFALKYIPVALKDMASAYRELQEAALTKERRNQLREQINADKELVNVNREFKNQLTKLLDGLYQRERRLLPRVRRFALYHVKDVVLRIKRSEMTGRPLWLKRAYMLLENDFADMAVHIVCKELNARVQPEVIKVIRELPQTFAKYKDKRFLSFGDALMAAIEGGMLPRELSDAAQRLNQIKNLATHRPEEIDPNTATEAIHLTELILEAFNAPPVIEKTNTSDYSKGDTNPSE